MIKINDRYFLDFTSELMIIVTLKNQLKLDSNVEQELLNIYRTYLIKGKKNGYANPNIISLKDSHPLAIFLEQCAKDDKIDLTINPFSIRSNSIVLNWPLNDPKITR